MLLNLSMATHLYHCDIHSMRELRDISVLRMCTQLRKLDISRTRVSSFSPLQSCTKLEYLDVSETCTFSRTPTLPILENLVYLNISFTWIKDITSLSHCKNLKKFLLEDSQVKDVSPLVPCTKLEAMNIVKCKIENLDIVSHLNVEFVNSRTL